MRGEEGDDLLRGDAHADGAADGFARDFARDHVWVAGVEADEELEDGNLELAGGVGVDSVVCFDDDEAFASVAGGGGEGVGGEIGEGAAAEGAGVGGEGCGETGRVEGGGGWGGLEDYTKVAQIEKHLGLSGGECGFVVGLAEFEGAEHEEEGEDVDRVHA